MYSCRYCLVIISLLFKHCNMSGGYDVCLFKQSVQFSRVVRTLWLQV